MNFRCSWNVKNMKNKVYIQVHEEKRDSYTSHHLQQKSVVLESFSGETTTPGSFAARKVQRYCSGSCSQQPLIHCIVQPFSSKTTKQSLATNKLNQLSNQ